MSCGALGPRFRCAGHLYEAEPVGSGIKQQQVGPEGSGVSLCFRNQRFDAPRGMLCRPARISCHTTARSAVNDGMNDMPVPTLLSAQIAERYKTYHLRHHSVDSIDGEGGGFR